MAHPKISIIIPVYNVSKYLSQCLDTVLKQTFHDIEIICVNDGSTDGSLFILEEFAARDRRIILVNHSYSSGSAALPRNTGLDLARGKYVIFLDSDDWFALNMLEKLYKHSESTNADLVMCDSYTVSFVTEEISEKDTELRYACLPKQEIFSYLDFPETIFQISSSTVWNKLILRKTLTQHNLRFQLGTPALDDLYFVNVLLVISKRISIIPDRLIFYRKSRYGAQTTTIEKHKNSIFLAFSALKNYLSEHSFYESVKISLQNRALQLMSLWLCSVGDYNVYCELHNVYRNIYFDKLDLMDIDYNHIYDDGIKRFYNGILGRNAEPSFKNVLESVLKPNSKIALYGAGLVGHNTFDLIKTQGMHEVVIWCDVNAEKLSGLLENPLIKHPRKLISHEFDAVIIAILDNDTVNSVKRNLLEMGFVSEKIFTI